MNSIELFVEEIKKINLTKVNKEGHILLDPEFEKFLIKLDEAKNILGLMDEKAREMLDKEFEKYPKLDKFVGDRMPIYKVKPTFKYIYEDPEKMLADKVLSQFVIVRYGVNSKAVEDYKEMTETPEKPNGELPSGIGEKEGKGYIKFGKIKNEEQSETKA